LEAKRSAGWRERLLDMIRQRLMCELVEHHIGKDQLEAHAHAIAEGREDPYRLVEVLWKGLLAHRPGGTAGNHNKGE